MSKTMLKPSALAILVAADLLLPGGAQAQTSALKSAPSLAPAVALETAARPLIDEKSKWPEVARMLTEAARIRSEDDPRGVDDLVIAAAAYRWAGKRTQARTTYVAAGERALALGDVLRAADAFVCAAVIAHEQKDDAGAWELKGRAERLAQSPLLTEGQRKLILTQFTELVQYAGHR